MEDVVIGNVSPGKVSTSFTDSLLRTLGYDRQNGNRLAGWNFVQCSANVSTGRNALVEWFLASPAQWLIQIDSDMVWQPDAVHRLLAEADPVSRPIVGGLCFAQEADTGQIWPTMYDLDGTAENPEFVRYNSWAPDAMFPVMATGAAFLLVHRSAFEKVDAAVGSRTYPWFRETELAGKRVGEDVTFCLRAQRCGLPVFVHTGVHIGHIKEHLVTTEGYIAQRIEEEARDGGRQGEVEDQRLRGRLPGDAEQRRDSAGVRGDSEERGSVRSVGADGGGEADPGNEGDQAARIDSVATEKVAVLVPVMRRPQNAAPFMTSLRATTRLATAYAIADADDEETIQAWEAAGATVVHAEEKGRPGTFAEKVNLGHRETDEPWLFLVGDDVRFRPGWLDQTQEVAAQTGAHVIGTNDLVNPRVTSGQHATHLLVRRSYVDEVGASWDGPGVVAAEVYHHWFVDDEIVTAAKQRGVWQMALGSVVEHNHPLFGKGEDDDVYRLGQSHAQDDKATWLSRLAANA